tara:strand:- start:520 stop:1389 length:870 start_codon:yes stop_codon:yes gene_type:complete
MLKNSSLKKTLKNFLEGFLVHTLYFFLKFLNINTSASFCKRLLLFFSSLLKSNDIAVNNVDLCFPTLTNIKRKQIINQSWEHFGAIIGEMPHWHEMSHKEFDERVIILGVKNILLSRSIFFSAHIGNWELFAKIAQKYRFKMHLLYRPMNNPYTDRIINKLRVNRYVELITKGRGGVRKIINALNSNEVTGMLVDQKLSEGTPVPFFRKMAMTTTLPAKLALKYGVKLVPAYVIRTSAARYTVRFFTPIKVSKEDSVYQITKKINSILEKWITSHPEQWLWSHNRWGNK